MPKYGPMADPAGIWPNILLSLIEEVGKGEPAHRMFTMTVERDPDSEVKTAIATLIRRCAPSDTAIAVTVDNQTTYLDGGRRKVDVWVTITKAAQPSTTPSES